MFAQVPVLHRKKPGAEVRHNDWHSGNPLWGKTTSWPRLRFCWRPPVVCGKSGQVGSIFFSSNHLQDCSSLWCQQVGYLGRVSAIHRSNPWLRGQSQNCLEQGGSGGSLQKKKPSGITNSKMKWSNFRSTTKNWCESMVLSCGRYPRLYFSFTAYFTRPFQGNQCTRVSENLRWILLGPTAQTRSLPSSFRERASEPFWWPSRLAKVRSSRKDSAKLNYRVVHKHQHCLAFLLNTWILDLYG